ncbi:MAG: TolC family protein [Myxococcaceae bacterium]
MISAPTLAAVFITVTAAAETEPALRVVTLPDALSIAKQKQPRLAEAQARVRQAAFAVDRVSAQWLPKAGASAQIFAASENNTTATYAGRSVLDIPRIGSGKVTTDPNWTPYGSTFVGIGALQEVFDFGRIGLERDSAQSHLDATKFGEQAEWLEVSALVELAFLSTRSGHSLVDSANDALQRAKLHQEFTRAGVTSGVRAQVDLLRAEAEVARAEVVLARAEAGLQQSQAVLGAAIGLTESVDAKGDEPVTPPPAGLDQLLQQAEQQYPRLSQVRKDAESAQRYAKFQGSLWRPDLGLTAGLNTRAGGGPPSSGTTPWGSGWAPIVPNWDVGLVLTWPVFDPVQLKRADEATARAEELTAVSSEAQLQLLSSVRQAYLAATTAREVLSRVERQRDAAVAASEQADARFKTGLGSTLELLEAESFRSEAEIQLVLAKFELARASSALQRTVGIPAGEK